MKNRSSAVECSTSCSSAIYRRFTPSQRPMNRATTTACGRGIPAPMRHKEFVVNADLRSLLKCVSPIVFDFSLNPLDVFSDS